MLNETKEKKVSYITEDTIVKGDITTNSAIIVKGKILGNLISNDDVEVRGAVEGEVQANNINVAGSQITGNVTCSGNLYIDKESVIDGNVSSNQAKLAGSVKGQLDIVKSVEILSSGNVEGDIHAESIAIEHGASIKGYIEIVKKAEPEPYKAPSYQSGSYSNNYNKKEEDKKVDDINSDIIEEL